MAPPRSADLLARIGRQHADLTAHVEAARELLLEGAEWEAMAAALDRSLRSLAEHFSDEEALMNANTYARATEHATQHAGILERVRVLRRQCDARETELVPVLLDYLKGALERHEATSDRAFAIFLADRA